MKMIIFVYMKESRLMLEVKKCKKYPILIFIVLVIFLLDQIIKLYITSTMHNYSKVLINGVLNLTYTKNTGGAFGIGKGSLIVFIIINSIIIGLLIYYVVKDNKIKLWSLISISLIIGGGLGNLADRVFRGYVIDYLDINPLFKYPVFNFADICIVLGSILLLGNLIKDKDRL